MEDWIEDLVRRGILTRSQAEAAGEDLPPASGSPGIPQVEAHAVLICVPCGTVYTITGIVNAPVCPACQAPLKPIQVGHMVSPAAPPPGARTFGRYVLKRELGRGGMGIVYEAHDSELGRSVALKMLVASGQEMNQTAVDRLVREARAVARLRHPSIVGIHDVGQAEGRHYFTMDLVEGKSLAELMADPGFPQERRVQAIAEIAEALGYAHSQGLVHRDVKPGNILIDRSGRAMLMDFGLARDVTGIGTPTLTIAGSILGTPQFMSPEQAARAHRNLGPPSDVFSLGAVLYFALTGVVPFPGDAVQSMHAVLHDTPIPPSQVRPGVPENLQTICLKCLQKDPERRYPDGGALAADLRRTLEGKAIEARPSEHAGGGATKEREALKLLEVARPALDKARQYLYDRNAEYEELVRRVDIGQTAIERALAVCPDLALAHYLHGVALDLRGDDAAAEAAWRESLRLEPDFGPAHFKLGCLLVETAYVQTVVSGRTPGVTKLLGEAMGALEKALAQGSGFDEAIQKEVARAMMEFTRSDRTAAAHICRAALDARPGAAGLETLYWVLGLCSNDEAARAALEKALEIRPKFPVALFKLGNIFFRKGELERAETCFADAARLKPGFTAAFHNLAASLLRRGQIPRAREILVRIVASSPGMAASHAALGSAHGLLGEPRQGLACANEALRLAPDEWTSWNIRGALHKQTGDHEAALRDYDQALRLKPDYTEALVNRANLQAELGFQQEALDGYGSALAIAPDCFGAINGRGWIFMEQGDSDRALAEFRRLLEIDPDSEHSKSGMSEVLLARKEYAEALPWFDRLLEMNPAELDGRAGRGLCRLALGDRTGAIDDLRRALETATPGWKRKEIAEDALRTALQSVSPGGASAVIPPPPGG